jgi:glycosyltransferase involved in cell wall biosynthesis
MRILQIATLIPVPPTDGGKLSVFGITKSLSKKGHKIDFVCYRKHEDYDTSYKLLSEYCTPYILDVQTDNSVWGALVNLFSPVPYNASKYYKKELTAFLKKYFKDIKPDIIQIDHLFLGWSVDEIRRLTSTPIILRSQNLEMNIMRRFYENQKNLLLKYFSFFQYKKFISYESNLCSKFNLCVMISEVDKNNLLSLNPTLNVINIPAGVESSLLEIKKKEVIPYSLVHIGHTDWYPNSDGLNWFISDVMPELVKKLPQIKLFIYGGGNTYKFPVPTKLKENIHVVGYVENLWEELQDKALAIVPLRIGSGIRMKILELLATGTNVITTSVGFEGINLNDEEEIIVANSKIEFCQKIVQYFNNHFNTKLMSQNGRNFVANNYTWNDIATLFEDAYTTISKDKINI